MGVTADQIVELFEADERARKRLAELLVTEPDVRLAIINAVLRDVATKRDLEEVRKELKEEISKLSDKVSDLVNRVGKVESQLSLLVKVEELTAHQPDIAVLAGGEPVHPLKDVKYLTLVLRVLEWG